MHRSLPHPHIRRIQIMNNIILTGLPASGKSTAGVILAKVTGRAFVDTDLIIQEREKALLPQIISERGTDAFLRCEEGALLSVNVTDTVIATGGSAVYSKKGMEHLSEGGKIVFLNVPEEVILTRLHDIRGRGVVLRDGQTLHQMIEERTALYRRYADITIDESGLTIEQTVDRILSLI